ncbi:MAG: hypothetical protein ACRDZO_20910 [Egibacteraceae bacterium]
MADLVTAHVAAGGKVTDPSLTVAVAKAIGLSDRTARRRLKPYRVGQVAVTAAGGAA